VSLLDYSGDNDHNRSVFTIVGEPYALKKAVLRGCLEVLKMIDMAKHQGAHPRIGAVDVVPFIPLLGTTLAETVFLANDFAREFNKASGVPIYYYGAAARVPNHKNLSKVRAGGYEALALRMKQPDVGKAFFNKTSGATAVGARLPLVAFNVNLESDDWQLARRIAAEIRETNGGLAKVQALGIFLESQGIAQVSTNITDISYNNMKTVFDAVRVKAQQAGVEIRNSELIGLAPLAAWGSATAADILLSNFSPKMILEERLAEFVVEYGGG